MNDMIIVIDFDGVLFDDQQFKKKYIRMFTNAGVALREYERTYLQSKKVHGGSYHPDAHLLFLKKAYPGLSLSALKKKRAELIGSSARCVFRDSALFLAHQKERGALLFLLSTGIGFQKQKIQSSGLSKYFKKVMVVSCASKKASLARMLRRFRGEPFLFIDDKKEVIDEIKRTFPNARAIQMARRRSIKRSKIADAVVMNFKELALCIEKKYEGCYA